MSNFLQQQYTSVQASTNCFHKTSTSLYIHWCIHSMGNHFHTINLHRVEITQVTSQISEQNTSFAIVS